MALDTTSVSALTDSIVSRLESSLNQSIPLLPKSFNRVLARAIAGIFIMLTQYNNFMFLQWFVSTCSSEDITILGVTVNPLNFWGSIFGLDGRGDGERAVLNVSVDVLILGETLDAGTQLTSAQNGFTYITTQAYTLSSTPFIIEVKAADDESGNNGVGGNGNLETGDQLSFVNSLSQVSKNSTVSGTVTSGADAETADSYRNRVLDTARRRPQGGAYTDYRTWGESVDGISNVYPYTGDPGEVDLYSEATEESSGSSDGIPTPDQLLAVKEAVEYDTNGKASRRPAGTFVNSYAITRTGFIVEVLGLAVDNETQVQTEITSAVTDFFVAAEPFIEGLSVPPRKDSISKVEVESVIIDVVKANNGSFVGVNLYEFATSAPVTIYQLGVGEKAKLSEISF